MKLSKEIIDQFVSWIDLKDVKNYARLQKAKEKAIKKYVNFQIIDTKEVLINEQKALNKKKFIKYGIVIPKKERECVFYV